MLKNRVVLILLVLGMVSLGGRAFGQSFFKPRIMIVFDTSASMTYITGHCPCDPDCPCPCDVTPGVCDGGCECDTDCPGSCGCDLSPGTCDTPNTFGDGSQAWPGNIQWGDSRMFIAKSAMANALYGTSEVEFGLMRYYQNEGEDIRCCMNHYGCLPGACGNGLCCLNYDGRNSCTMEGGQVIVDISPTSHDAILGWMDGVEAFPLDKELRADGETPIAGSLDVAGDYFRTQVIPGDPVASCRGYYVLLLTDGEETCSADPVASAQALRSLEVNGQNHDVKTYVIGFGADVAGSDTLNSLAQAGSGEEAFFAIDLLSLQTAVNRVIQNAIIHEDCNNADDDCDGEVDEDLIRPCLTECGVGTEYCVEGEWLGCDAVQPGPEECNNHDDNCDGQVDEGLTQPCSTDCGEGTESCVFGVWRGCDAPLPGVEVCDRLDNDCDGYVDEDVIRPCQTECGSGVEVCTDGSWGPCNAPVQSPEVCDGLDNDCDGTIDEDLTQDCQNDCGTGQQICVEGEWVNCTAPDPVNEVCNGIDDDCDGDIDEDLTRECFSDCGQGVETCEHGFWVNCTAPRPEPESCDGEDNDCDGDVDEGLIMPCSSPCGSGIYECVDGAWVNCSAVEPRPESCDGIDNDCDGTIDEDLFQPCSNSCGPGTEFCSMGHWVGCTAPPPLVEVCDSIDNDCDGDVDEHLTQPCSNACGSGTETCVLGRWQGCTAPTPQPETCNGLDDNCDGLIDEGLTQSCSNACGQGTEVCEGGHWVRCTAPVPASERCDGADNDCDGQVDEDLQRSCYSACGQGQETCINGFWVNCDAPRPITEVCNGQDDDCDGNVDENLSRPCNNSCGTGFEVCQGGDYVNCTAPAPQAEVCDGLDNDCDGMVDNGLTRDCQTACGQGQETCVAGDWVNCNASQPLDETCNGVDDDCDGEIDENLTKACRSRCGEGEEVCENGNWVRCSAPEPSEEVCDSKDNDCDGLTDEDLVRSCTTLCGEGEERCLAGVWGQCEIPTSPEVCNGEDDDCDGQIDEGVFRSCDTVCGPGQEVCVNGAYQECNAPQPAAEECDGLDNDCDGQIDEDLFKSCFSACGSGKTVCLAGVWGPCDAPEGEEEVCDSRDNDCDGEIDEDIVVSCENECGPGLQVCINGVMGPCSAPQPGIEVCDCLDNDCDGIVDNNGASDDCPEGLDCYACQCANRCQMSECPVGQICIIEDDYCIVDPCYGVYCPGGRVCEDGACIDPSCMGVACDDDLVCDHGTCVDKNCYIMGCPEGEACFGGECVADPCREVVCLEGEFCRDGLCVASCAAVECDNGEHCRDGECVSDPCAGVSCEAEDICVAGTCIHDDCLNVATCPSGLICDNGRCVEDPCIRIRCSGGEVCDRGQCVAMAPVEPDGGVADDGGQDGGQARQDVFQASDVATPDLGQPKAPADGCGCQLGASSPPAGPLAWLLILGLAFPLLRRRSIIRSGLPLGALVVALLLAVAGCGDSSTPPIGGEDVPDVSLDPCQQGYQSPEICDGEDNDCDGQIDEDYHLMTDPRNCGLCGVVCQIPNAVAGCVGGECTVDSCIAGYTDDDDDPANGCETTCEESNGGVEACDGRDNDCDGVVDEGFDLDRDTGNCGTCNNRCSFPQAEALCIMGICKMGDCDAGRADLDHDPVNGCEGRCTVTNEGNEICDSIDNDCDGQVDEGFDLVNSVTSCGSCDRICAFANAIPLCVEGECVMEACLPGYTDRDGNVLNGCEAECTGDGAEVCDGMDNDCNGVVDDGFDLQTDPENCGICGNWCAFANAVAGCEEGWCVIDHCEAGYADLDHSLENGCEALCTISHNGVELCDNQDNDCDGFVDEEFDLLSDPNNCGSCNRRCEVANATAACERGICQVGECKAGYWDINQVPGDGCEYTCEISGGGEEVCDGLDNNCNSVVDEGFDLEKDPEHCGRCDRRCELANAIPACSEGDCIVSACEPGYVDSDGRPENGCENDCIPTAGGVEVCDEVDNDCDGFVDDGFDKMNDPRHCGECNWVCSFINATPSCQGGECVMGLCLPGYHDLNGDDGDGCEYPCVDTGAEECDRVDNDCDGQIDEGYDFDSSILTCGSCDSRCDFENAVPACEGGVCVLVECLPGWWDQNRQPHDGCEERCEITNGGVEACDNLDNDCNGLVDDGFDLQRDPNHCGFCNHVCDLDHAEAVCVAGQCRVAHCEAGYIDLNGNSLDGCEEECLASGEEVCDGLDNDCDGRVDDGFDLDRDPLNCGECNHVCELDFAVAACQGGDCLIAQCEVGHYDRNLNPEDGCEVECLSMGIELCDGQDNNCDGLVDEGFDLTSDANHCGECNHSCSALFPGAYGVCASRECIMADCLPGMVDLNNNTNDGCEYACQPTGQEICDYLDNDCDGERDETYDLQSDGTNCGACGNICHFDHAAASCEGGICVMGQCDPGFADFNRNPVDGCEAECVATGEEVCDSEDNDCDGEVDEGYDLRNDVTNCGFCGNVCALDHATVFCNSGQCDVLGCEQGYRNLDGERENGCECALNSETNGIEVCNAIDDDCSGVADDNLGAPPAEMRCLFLGVCEGVAPTCLGQDGWACVYPDAYQEGGETLCDGLDNDCDGLTDEDFEDLGQPCWVGQGVCEGEGMVRCQDNQLTTYCDAQEHPENEAQEVCNGLDDDCDGQVDEDVDELVDLGTFRIYRYEASRIDATDTGPGTSFARSCSRPGVLPWYDVTWQEAQNACQAAGLRLCTMDEWERACMGPGLANLYPYGDEYFPAACNGKDYLPDPDPADPVDHLLLTGDAQACFSAEAVYDLSGNLWEWLADDLGEGNHPFKGGGFANIAEGLTCTYTNASEGGARYNIGFRCCGD